ncbi:MerR family transcriptional regulator [Priestia endophytica]|uniref:MerR family transcriptional regulator n=1 Tax=Priestia endophytica TaxID=135735 RepID=UPI002E1DB0AA|nr:MerR family transcriptional regulator [Priestia endophytica]MED4071626.1 MerR family transcriptional regulator [Priestia endophytica]
MMDIKPSRDSLGGVSIGAEKLKIGELAKLTGLTKRTIDYYTNMGLLEAERSTSNYRFYDCLCIEKIEYIEKCKKRNQTLEEIKKSLQEKEAEEIDILELRLKMKGLEKELNQVLDQKGDKDARDLLKKGLSKESFSLIQSLLLLLH